MGTLREVAEDDENRLVKKWWDVVGKDAPLVTVLGTKGARETGVRARDILKELSRQRNPSISESQLRDAINFIAAFRKALNAVVAQRLSTGIFDS